jgi:hypothetical protein
MEAVKISRHKPIINQDNGLPYFMACDNLINN